LPNDRKSTDTLVVLWQDHHFIAIDKPAGLASIPGRAETDSVLERLARQLNLPCAGVDDPRLRVVHRLDKDTSGVMLFAKDRGAQQHVSHQFQNNTVQKEYLALVRGRPGETSGDIDAPLAPHPTSRERMAISKQGRPARTMWKVEEQFREYALLRAFPKTGKTHQIRVHLRSIGLPLAIDPLYNPQSPGGPPGLYLSTFKRGYHRGRSKEERPLIARLTLHAERLTFVDLDQTARTIESPLPKDFRAALNMLRKYAR
jgi:23S rRNA pseudouridine1911/1915/1917 synthase